MDVKLVEAGHADQSTKNGLGYMLAAVWSRDYASPFSGVFV